MLVVSGILTHALLFRQEIQGNTDFTRTLPLSLGKWSIIDEIPATENEIRGLETQDIVRRIYSDGKDVVELVVAYIAQSSRKSAHAQEACLRGAGAQVSTIENMTLPEVGISGKAIRLEYHDRRHWVFYYYKIGDIYTADYLRSSWLMFFGGLSGRQGQGSSLIRLLTPQRMGEEPEAAKARLSEFAKLLKPELESALP